MSEPTVTVLRTTDDGSARYRVELDGETCEFTIERSGGGWYCYSGFTFLVHPEDFRIDQARGGIWAHAGQNPGSREFICTSREDGWGTYGWRGHRRCMSKVLRSVRRQVLERQKRRELEQSRLDLRLVHQMPEAAA